MKYVFFAIAVLLLFLSPFVGETSLELSKLLDATTTDYLLFWDLRLPRTITAFFSGAILALGGLVFQAVFRNALTTPFTLGVSSGATLAAAFAIVFLPASLGVAIPLFSFAGAFSTVLLLFLFARTLNALQTHSLLLIGIALSFFYSAALMVLYYLSDLQQSYSIIRFTMGSLNVVGFSNVYPLIGAALLFFFIIRYFRGELVLILTSYENAFLKGINVKKINLIFLLAVSLSVGVCVSIIGPIGFVGLVIPHIIKLVYRQSSDKLLLPVFFYGGVFLVLCDLIARNLGTVSEVPIGVVTSFVGGPFFIYLVLKRRNSHG